MAKEKIVTHENLSDLIAALPEDNEAAGIVAPDERLREILADLARRPAPAGSLHRLWTMGELSAQVSLAYFALWVRGWFSNAEARKQRVMETNLRVALKIFHRLAYLRGAMIKLGQAAGHLPELLPAEIADTLDRLHFEAPPMHYSLIRAVIENEFGRAPEEVFVSFEKEAFAAASIGQVHRARLRSGEEVAVKIQYPGIARTIDADFRNLNALLFPLRLGNDWEYVKPQFAEVHRMLNQEADYRQEAEAQSRARKLFTAEDEIIVPRVFEAYSTARVLTTELLRGRHLNGVLATNPPQALRDHFGTLLERAHLRLYFAYLNHADPSPGNFLFLDDGRLGVLDFGCVQQYGEEERELVRLSEGLIAEDEPAVKELFEMAFCHPRADDPDREKYWRIGEMSRHWMMEPMRADGPFDFGDEGHIRRGYEVASRMIRERVMRGHPFYVHYQRFLWGAKALLYRLRARVNLKELHRQESEIWRRRGEG
jgi:predicted unusual protein kinase regulating ubiquinone biosynthesis (AarF/ABC1/UbiB family)